MKKTKYILLLTLSAFSFYITDKVLIFIDEQKPLMKEIKLNASKYETAPVNSVIVRMPWIVTLIFHANTIGNPINKASCF